MSQINARSFQHFDPKRVPSPCFVVDQAVVEANLQRLADLQAQSGAKVLAALKAFSFWRLGELTGQYLHGSCASGLHEARLAKAHYPGEVHTFSAGFKADELPEILSLSDHIVFNSVSQWQRFRPLVEAHRKNHPELQVGLRVNPEHSEGDVALYDPCAPCSRLGIPASELPREALEGVSGLHFHTLCEQGFEPLARTLAAFEAKFADVLPSLEWVNFGGGHHITKVDYDFQGLVDTIRAFSERYQLQVYLEPGEAIAIHSGVLVSEVLDITHNHMPLAILDSSATCHMPDTLEMPYRAEILGAGTLAQKPHGYRLGGMSCLAGDVMGDYAFDQPLSVGQRLMFDDMAHYTMVKTTTFNGIPLPALALWDSRTDSLEIVREFEYADFEMRLS